LPHLLSYPNILFVSVKLWRIHAHKDDTEYKDFC
jgi:hypothetical protein